MQEKIKTFFGNILKIGPRSGLAIRAIKGEVRVSKGEEKIVIPQNETRFELNYSKDSTISLTLDTSDSSSWTDDLYLRDDGFFQGRISNAKGSCIFEVFYLNIDTFPDSNLKGHWKELPDLTKSAAPPGLN